MGLINGSEVSKTALAKRLTNKHKIFAREYIRTGSLAEAARRAGHPDQYARQIGWQYMNDPRYVNVRMYVEMLGQEIEDIKKITPEHIAVGMLKEATEGDVAGARVRAWELLGKWRGMLTEKVEIGTDQPVIYLLKALVKVDKEMAEKLAPMFGYSVEDLKGDTDATSGERQGHEEKGSTGSEAEPVREHEQESLNEGA